MRNIAIIHSEFLYFIFRSKREEYWGFISMSKSKGDETSVIRV